MPKLLIFDAFTLLIREKTVANYALLRCKTFSLKIWLCKILDKYHVYQAKGQRVKWNHEREASRGVHRVDRDGGEGFREKRFRIGLPQKSS